MTDAPIYVCKNAKEQYWCDATQIYKARDFVGEYIPTDTTATALIEAERRGVIAGLKRAEKISQEVADKNTDGDWLDMAAGAEECVAAIRQAAAELGAK